MADIPLRTYVEQIDNLVEKKQIDEAIAHCKHILTYFPKHLGTYQALGKALLEKGRHADAADIFKRVLSAIPDDYVSHIGMSIVCEDQGNTEGALWHMERAFEVMPANPAIQDELRRLYGRRDGLMPPRTRLTRGALARMYVKGGLFAQAEAELKKALADAPDRVDLATVLAQVYWQTNRRQEAADTCANLVEKQPYNQEANRMLADILLAQGRTAELVPYRQRLEALDPYAAFADPNTDGHGPAPKPETVLIPKLDYTPDMAASAAGTPDWVTSIGATLEQPGRTQTSAVPDWLPKAAPTQEEVTRAAELPDWLQGAQVALGSTPAQASTQAGPLPSAEGDMPDWMKTAVTTPLDMPEWMKTPPAAEAAPAAPAAEENADWTAATATAGEIPDWMQGLAPAGETATRESSAIAFAAPVAAAEAAPAPDMGALSEDEALRWMEGLALQQGAKPEEMVSQPLAVAAETAAAAPAAEEVPDWLKAAEAAPAEELPAWMQAPAAEAAPAEELPAWMQAPAAEAPAEALPDWLKQTTAAEAAPALAAETPAPDLGAMGEEDALRWMEGLALQQGAKPEEMVSQPLAVAAETAAAAPAAEEVPDWLKAAEAAPAEELPAWMQAPAEALPDWLKQTTAAEAAPAVAAETPAPDLGAMGEEDALRWMEGLALQQGAKPEEMVSQPLAVAAETAAAAPVAEEVPAWLKAAEAAPAEELPAWMQAPAAEAAPTAAPVEELPAWMEAQPPAPHISPPAELGVTAPLAAELPDWLKAAEAASPAEELPDWLKEQASGAVEGEAAPVAAAELPEWLSAQTPAVAAPAEAGEKPDWLKQMEAEADAYDTSLGAAPAEPAPAEPAPALPAAEAEKPDWLKQMEAEADAYDTSLAAAPAEPTLALPAAEAEKPDWLKQMEAEADVYDTSLAAAPAEPAPALPAAEAEKPDWLKQMEAEADAYDTSLAAAPAEPAPALPAAEAEKPDWLKQMEAEADAYDASVAPAVPQPVKAKLRPDELPDFLQMATAAAVERSEQPTHLADELEQESVAEPEEPALAAAEIPDWLKPFSPAAAEPEAAATPQPAETIQWLESTSPAPTLAPAEPVAPAELTAEIPEWVKRPAEKTEAASLADLPSWVQEPPPGPSDTVSLWLAKKKIPDWLRSPDEEAKAQPPVEWLRAPVEEAPKPQAPEPPAPPTPSKETEELATKFLGSTSTPAEEIAAATEAPAAPAEVSEDDALRWLEELAQQQGAPPEELITTTPEERLAAEAQPAPEVPAIPPQPEEEKPRPPTTIEEQVTKPLDQLPSWLTLDILDTVPPEPPVAPIAEAPAAPTAPAAMGDEALRWLENLAVQQGARSEELVTKPEERLAQPPAWVAAETKAAAAAETQAAPTAEIQPTEIAPVETLAAPAAEAPAPPAPPAPIQESVTRPLEQLPALLTVETPEPTAAVEPPAAPVEPAAMGDDEALRWLESLAVQQGARPEELVTKPEERLAQPPAWVAAETQAADIAKTQAAAAATFETPAAPEIPAAPVAEAPAGPAAMGDDEALRWLESLAVQQGARPEELVTKPEERLAQPPAWVAAETQAAAAAEIEAAEIAKTQAAAAATFETPAAPEIPAEPVAEAPAPVGLAAMSDDEALRWLESLAVQQGARPEELVTKPEERLAQPPAWVAAETQAAAAAETQAAAAAAAQPAEVEPPAGAPSVVETAAREPELPALSFVQVPPEPEAVSDEPARDARLSKLAEKLAASRRAKEVDIEARFASKRTEQEAIRRAVQEKMERKTTAPEKATRPVVPAEALVTPEATQPSVTVTQPKPKPDAGAARAPAVAKPKVPAAPKPRRIKLSKSPYAAEAPETVLALARQRLAEGDPDQAAEPLAYLVASNQLLQHTISELETYTAREHSAPLLQILGDAYMKTNQLQKALETYRQALGHL